MSAFLGRGIVVASSDLTRLQAYNGFYLNLAVRVARIIIC